jgi:hypothetical protein
MAEEEVTGTKGKKKKSDYAEVEFEIGNIEFEAKGRSVVVERMFRLLLEKIEEGKLVAEFRLQDDDEEEEEEEEKDGEMEASDDALPPDTLEELEEEEPIPLPSGDFESKLDPPPAWDTLETEEPSISDAEKEEFDL